MHSRDTRPLVRNLGAYRINIAHDSIIGASASKDFPTASQTTVVMDGLPSIGKQELAPLSNIRAMARSFEPSDKVLELRTKMPSFT